MEFSEEDRQYSSEIVGRLINGNLETELPSNLVISDIEMDIRSFLSDLEFAKEYASRLPVLKINGDNIPVSLQSLFDAPFLYSSAGTRRWRQWRFDFPYFAGRASEILELLERPEQTQDFSTADPDQAREMFALKAIDFLATRVAAVKSFQNADSFWNIPELNLLQNLGGKQIITPGCSFSVSANSAGLRVFWSGAYYIAPKYFSQPTSPAISVLQSGTYVFGIDGGAYGNKIQWDTNAVVSLPGNPSVYLNY